MNLGEEHGRPFPGHFEIEEKLWDQWIGNCDEVEELPQ